MGGEAGGPAPLGVSGPTYTVCVRTRVVIRACLKKVEYHELSAHTPPTSKPFSRAVTRGWTLRKCKTGKNTKL